MSTPWYVYVIIFTPSVALCSLLWYANKRIQKGSDGND